MILASLVRQGWDISQIRGYTSEDFTVLRGFAEAANIFSSLDEEIGCVSDFLRY